MQELALEHQAMLAALVDSSDDAIISKNLQGFITSWNPAATNIFGYTREEMIGNHITTLIPQHLHPEEEYIISRIIAGKKVDHFQTVRQTKDGRLIPVSITVSPIVDKAGRIIGASKIARNVQQQVEQTKRLEELNRSKDEFIGIASHELKTPLTSIKAYAQLLERKLANDETNHHFITRMVHQVDKLTTLVNDLLDVSKIQAGKIKFEFEQFDLNALILDAIDTIQLTASHEIHYQSFEHPVYITADCQRIEQVLINLLSNAVKYSPNGKKIIVECGQEADHVQVNVTDFGIGITPADQEKIFSRFYRAKGLAPGLSGLGIGLYISHEITTRHNGKLWVHSELGQGSVFSFRIPIRQPNNT